MMSQDAPKEDSNCSFEIQEENFLLEGKRQLERRSEEWAEQAEEEYFLLSSLRTGAALFRAMDLTKLRIRDATK